MEKVCNPTGSQYLKKSKSMCSLIDNESNSAGVPTGGRADKFYVYRRQQSRTISDSSVDIYCVPYSDSDDPGRALADSGIADKSVLDGDMLLVLEQKIDRLSDMFLEQSRLLTILKDDIRNSKSAIEKAENAQSEILSDLVKKAAVQSSLKELCSDASDGNTSSNSRARSLLDAIEVRQGVSMDREIRDLLFSFLQSDELKDHMVAATAESVKNVIGDCMSRDFSALYLPILEHSHRRLMRQVARTVEEAFIELEENSACLSKSVFKITKTLRRSVERHQTLLDAAADPQKNLINTLKYSVEELLQSEMKQWRQKVLDAFSSQLSDAIESLPEPHPPLQYEPTTPTSPHQPADPECSVINQLMIAAEISKQIQDGDANAAFERALSAGDLCLVTAACRAAEVSEVFVPHCRLHQHVLLALLQQLSTDMLHDTALKCRFLEDSIMNLNPANAPTHTHLPLVVGEVRRHLTKFLSSYPGHTASRRIALIIMAAENLLKS